MKKLICGILMLGTIAGVYGQKVMSLEECRLLALENNKKLKMADEQINAGKNIRDAPTGTRPGLFHR